MAMKIDDLVCRLLSIRKQHGNLPVTRDDWQDHNMPTKLEDLAVITVKEHYDVYVKTACLAAGGFAGRQKFVEPYQTEVLARPNIKVVFFD